MSLPRQLRDESDFDQLPNDIPVSATIADIQEKKGFIVYYWFVIEVKTKGGSKHLIYRRYHDFFTLHQSLEQKFSSESEAGLGGYSFTLPTLPGKVYLGKKQEIAENRIPELNTYMKKLLSLPTYVLLEDVVRMFFYQCESDSLQIPRTPRRLRPPTRRVKTVKTKPDLLSSPRAEAVFDFSRSGPLELSLRAGEVIFLLRRVNADWLEGTVRERTGIFPQSFVKIIKPLPESDSEGEGERGPSGALQGPYSCMRCYLYQAQGVETRDICVEEELSTRPAFSELLTLTSEVFKLKDIALNYRDLEGDLIRILDDEDVELMVSEGQLHGSEVKRPVNQFPWELHVTLTLIRPLSGSLPQHNCTAHNVSTQHFSSVLESLQCYNDFTSHIRCSWIESARTHPRTPLSLFHLDIEEDTESQCLPYGPAVPLPEGQLAVHCQYNTGYFPFENEDTFFFKTPHAHRLFRSLSLSQLVRVRPPHSLSQRAAEGGGSVLHWQSSYLPSSPLYPTLNYQVNYRRLGQDWTVLAVSGKELVLKADSLVSGSWYEARVRGRGGEGLWSEWSPLVQWRTEDAPVPGPSNLQCVFDGEAAVSCSWEVKPDLAQFITYRLSYRTDPTAQPLWCCADPPVNVGPGLSALRFSCSFSVSDPGQLQVELTPSKNSRLFLSQENIRPIPPTNVKLQEKGEDWVLSWASQKSRAPITFQVWYWRTDTPGEVKEYNETAPSHHIHQSSLLPSTGYMAQVRSMVTSKGGVYSGTPSDWTETIHWMTHPAPWSLSTLLSLLVGVCAAVVFLVLLFTFPACKRRVMEWEGSIPSPFKSKVLVEIMKKSANDCLESRTQFDRATVRDIQVQENVQTARYSLCLSEDCSQLTYLTTTEDDESYRHISGVGANPRGLSGERQPEDTSCKSLSDLILCPEFSWPKSRGVVGWPCMEDRALDAPTSQQTLLECGSEYVAAPPAKTVPSWDVSIKRLEEELEVQYGYIDNRFVLLGPPESGVEPQPAPGPVNSDRCPYIPIPPSIHSVIIQQNMDGCHCPNPGPAVRGTAPPSTPPAGYRSKDITVDHNYVSLLTGNLEF
ncbi:hypothetical protein AAFF_G00296130 [Aldrovandia affinis]|uniref:Uncharacterized protein n=1 Tax=Aldrovandia affinis TaxID=143900 RepID=A0AAD7SQ04_9TELE|nr:hypothetical protein AAFF_G00296130 [Aldrovandia affinis]